MARLKKEGKTIVRRFRVRKKFDDLYIWNDHLIWVKHENMDGYIVYQEFEDLLEENQYMTPAQFEKYKRWFPEQ